jgi:hypothetical protein
MALNYFWKLAYICYPSIRDFLLFTRIMKHSGRQNFLIGILKSGIDKEDFKKFLEKKGFERSILSWIDDDEVLCMRKRMGKKYQYHIRLFCDNEIRGHYEYAPECKPLDHLNAVSQQKKSNYFKTLLSSMV